MENTFWYKDAIIYQLHVRAFRDSNEDGIGDFRGLIEKLDYLEELGITAIWLLPFYPSPLKDDGYDIADYLDVHPFYGKLDDFREFLAEAHKRGLYVITELVINHTSDQHPWFQEARKPGSPLRDLYVWNEDDQKFQDTRIIFRDIEKSNWAFDPVAKAYYWHRFFTHQPDLNHNNPEVVKRVIDVLKYWLDMGVDGLRLDAIPYLCVREGTNNENIPETHAVIKQIRKAIDENYGNRMLLAEANQWPKEVREYFGDDDECHMAFHFPIMPRLYIAVAQGDASPIHNILEQTPDIPENCQWALFLRNHDELTLEMVTQEESDYMYETYAPDPRMRLNWGIRRRLAPLLKNNRSLIQLMHSMIFSLPGTPIIYYGDEIGLGENIYLKDRDGVRTPMQWDSDKNAGFSGAEPERLYSQPIRDDVFGYASVNVRSQRKDPSSLWHFMRKLIHLRKKYKAFGRGSIEFIKPENQKILCFMRQYQEERILVVANLADSAQPVKLDLEKWESMLPVELFGETEFPRITKESYPLSLAPHAFYWFKCEKE